MGSRYGIGSVEEGAIYSGGLGVRRVDFVEVVKVFLFKYFIKLIL